MKMGDSTVESSGLAANSEEIITQNGSRNNKKQKRRSRRSKQKNSLSASASVNETCKDDDTCLQKYDISVEASQEALSITESMDKLCIWDLLKKKKILYSNATVVDLGPGFVSVYIPELDIERCIHCEEAEGLTVEWLNATSTLLLGLSTQKPPNTKNSCRPLDETALIINPAEVKLELINCEPSFLPLTLRIQSTLSVALHAVGGGDGPLDVVARLYLSSYYH